MKTREEQQAMVDSMKRNKEAFQFWPTDWQKWAVENYTRFWVAKTGMQPHGSFDGTRAYQLDSDFQLPPEPVKERTVKWFNCETGRTLDCPEGICPGEAWVTVPVYVWATEVKPKFVERTIPIIKDKKGRLAVALDGMKPLSEAWLYAINRGLCAWFSYPDKDGQVVWITNPCGISGKAPTQIRLMMEEQK